MCRITDAHVNTRWLTCLARAYQICVIRVRALPQSGRIKAAIGGHTGLLSICYLWPSDAVPGWWLNPNNVWNCWVLIWQPAFFSNKSKGKAYDMAEDDLRHFGHRCSVFSYRVVLFDLLGCLSSMSKVLGLKPNVWSPWTLALMACIKKMFNSM